MKRDLPWWIAVLAITIARFALSLRGLDYGLPETHEPDVELVRQSLHFRGEVTAKPEQLAVYPHLISRLMALVPRPEVAPSSADEPSLEAHLEFAARHFHAARLCVALLSAVAIPLTWLLARSFLGRPWSLLATLLLATSLLHYDYSQQARPHGPLTTFVLAAIVSAIALAQRASLARYGLAGCCAALAVGALHSGAAVLFAGLAAHILAQRSQSKRNPFSLLLPVLLVAGAYAYFYPFWFTRYIDSPPSAATALEETSEFPHKVKAFDGSGFVQIWKFFWDYDPLLWAFALLGVGYWVRDSQKRRSFAPQAARTAWIVCAAGSLPYLLVIGAYSRIFVRFLEPLLPLAAVLASSGLMRLLARLPNASRRALLGIASAVLLLAFPSYLLWRLGSVRSQPDTLSQCASWLTADAKWSKARVLLTPTLSLPLFHGIVRREDYEPWASPASHFWHRYLWDLPVESLPVPLLDLRYISRGGHPYMDLADYPKNETKALQYIENLRGHLAIVTAGGPMLDSVRLVVQQKGKLLHTISPWREGAERTPLGLDERGDDFWQKLLAARCTGPQLEIYQLGTKN